MSTANFLIYKHDLIIKMAMSNTHDGLRDENI